MHGWTPSWSTSTILSASCALVDWPIEVDAVYEGGVLKPDRPLPLEEGARVRLTIQILAEDSKAVKDVDDPTG